MVSPCRDVRSVSVSIIWCLSCRDVRSVSVSITWCLPVEMLGVCL